VISGGVVPAACSVGQLQQRRPHPGVDHLVWRTVVVQLCQPCIDLLIQDNIFLPGPVGGGPVEELLAHRILGQPSHPRLGQRRNVLNAGHLVLRQQCAVWAEPAVLLPSLGVDRRPSGDIAVMGLDDLDVTPNLLEKEQA
jgi:hypothetical protein